METTEDVKSDSAADSKNTSLDNAGTDELAAVSDINDVDVKTEEGIMLIFWHCSLRF